MSLIKFQGKFLFYIIHWLVTFRLIIHWLVTFRLNSDQMPPVLRRWSSFHPKWWYLLIILIIDNGSWHSRAMHFMRVDVVDSPFITLHVCCASVSIRWAVMLLLVSSCLPSYPGYFREPHWKSMGLPEICRYVRSLKKSRVLYRLLIWSYHYGIWQGDGSTINRYLAASRPEGPFTNMV